MVEDTVHKKVCKTCGKIIRSLNERQAECNLESHMLTHKKEEKKDE